MVSLMKYIEQNEYINRPTFVGIDFSFYDFSKSLLNNQLKGARFYNCNFSSTVFREVDLSYADFHDDCIFLNTDFRGANLYSTNFHNNALHDSIGVVNDFVILYNRPIWRMFVYRHNGVIRIKVACRDFSLTEAKDYWSKPRRTHSVPTKEYSKNMLTKVNDLVSIFEYRGW